MSCSYTNRTRPLLSLVLVVAATVVTTAQANATSKPVTHRLSYAEFYSQTTSDVSAASPCTSKTCANGIRFTWAAESCYQGDRYLPIALVWTSKGTVSTKAWPLTAPCSSGFEFSWDKYDQLSSAKWLRARSSASKAGLAVCFQYANQCNAGHCVTAGCLPKHTTGVDLFFQGGDSPTGATWLVNGKPDGTISLTGSPNNVFWYGYTPPASPFATSAPTSTSSRPAVTITGRTGGGNPQVTNDVPPSSATGVDMTWYQPSYDPSGQRGCHQVNGQYWTSPPLAFAYTTNGQLNSPVTVPMCPVESGNVPSPFSDILFSWTSGSSGSTLTSAHAFYDQLYNEGCQGNHSLPSKSWTDPVPSDVPQNTVQQPPPGANGLVFAFSHDDFKSSCWRQDHVVMLPALDQPGHPRMGVFQG